MKESKDKIILLSITLTFITFMSIIEFHFYNKQKKDVVTEIPKTEVIYLLGEKKECEDKEGRFIVNFSNLDIPRKYTPNPNEIIFTTRSRINDYSFELKCTKEYTEGNKDIIETIFDYKIK